MSNTVKAERGLEARFNQPSGPSRPGIDWAVRITGERAGMVVVRTYFSSDPPLKTEKAILAEKAERFVKEKLELGWTPERSSFLQIEDV